MSLCFQPVFEIKKGEMEAFTEIDLIDDLSDHENARSQNQPIVDADAVRLQNKAHVESQTGGAYSERDEHGSDADESGKAVHGGSGKRRGTMRRIDWFGEAWNIIGSRGWSILYVFQQVRTCQDSVWPTLLHR